MMYIYIYIYSPRILNETNLKTNEYCLLSVL